MSLVTSNEFSSRANRPKLQFRSFTRCVEEVISNYKFKLNVTMEISSKQWKYYF